MREPVARNPVPSLLRSLMSVHLDPGYEAAASKARDRGTDVPNGRDRITLVGGALLVGCVFGVALTNLSGLGLDDTGPQREVLASVREAESRADALESERAVIADEIDSAQSDALANDTDGTAVLTDLRSLESAAGAESIQGPGIVVTVDEPPDRANLSDVSKPSRGASQATVLDRDLQIVINSLWVSGAEAITVNEVRIGPNVTIRQAGGAMLVDNQPVFSPYAVSAIGSSSTLQSRFSISDAYLRLTALSQLYRVGFDIETEDAIAMPATSVRQVRSATTKGSP